jgi:hypothetical protein
LKLLDLVVMWSGEKIPLKQGVGMRYSKQLAIMFV